MVFVRGILSGESPTHTMLNASALGRAYAYPALELSDRGHKVYAHREGIKNAGEGAIKFYVCHAQDQGDIDLINEALRKCRAACAEAEAAARSQKPSSP
jgi:hypothetical protein